MDEINETRAEYINIFDKHREFYDHCLSYLESNNMEVLDAIELFVSMLSVIMLTSKDPEGCYDWFFESVEKAKPKFREMLNDYRTHRKGEGR